MLIHYLKSYEKQQIEETFSISSIQACRSRPKSMNVQAIPSRLYSSCSKTNMWWLKNCCSRSLTKLIHNCSNELNCKFKQITLKQRSLVLSFQHEGDLKGSSELYSRRTLRTHTSDLNFQIVKKLLKLAAVSEVLNLGPNSWPINFLLLKQSLFMSGKHYSIC